MSNTHDIQADSVDELVVRGLALIRHCGEKIDARGLSGLQAYNVTYVLTDPRNRVCTLRAPDSVRYLARELTAFFGGSLKSEDMSRASRFWLTLEDENKEIASNYGHYVFYQKTPEGNSQYEWVINLLTSDIQSRRAVININQVSHKVPNCKDIPCNIAMHFFVRTGSLCCVVSSRSTDIITGLPYNMGFFSLVTELVWKDLQERGARDLALGYCMMKSNLTQLYDNRLKLAERIDNTAATAEAHRKYRMPAICSASQLLSDIYNNTQESAVAQWCRAHS